MGALKKIQDYLDYFEFFPNGRPPPPLGRPPSKKKEKRPKKSLVNRKITLPAQPYEGAAVVYVGDSHHEAFPGAIRKLVINLGGDS